MSRCPVQETHQGSFRFQTQLMTSRREEQPPITFWTIPDIKVLSRLITRATLESLQICLARRKLMRRRQGRLWPTSSCCMARFSWNMDAMASLNRSMFSSTARLSSGEPTLKKATRKLKSQALELRKRRVFLWLTATESSYSQLATEQTKCSRTSKWTRNERNCRSQ